MVMTVVRATNVGGLLPSLSSSLSRVFLPTTLRYRLFTVPIIQMQKLRQSWEGSSRVIGLARQGRLGLSPSPTDYYVSMEVLVALSCLTLCDPMDWSPPGSSVHGILLARTVEWVAMPSSMVSYQPRDWTCVSCNFCITGGFFTIWATRLAPM